MTRRELVRASGAGAAAAAVWACLPPAIAATSVDAAVEELLAGKAFIESRHLRLDLPPRFDYGNTVPFAVTIESPMTEADHVRRVSVFAEGNPFPEVASVHFTPANGRASASTRIRLNEGKQEVVAVAELSDGRAWLARRTIEVAISGCSTESGVAVGYVVPLPQPRLKVPAEVRRHEIVEVKTMISHRMETGLRIDAGGNPIPRRIINRMVCARDGEPIFAADLTPAIAANAYLSFPMVARESAVLTFAWREDGGAEYHASHSLTVI
jgi:sulfur-oxidizing protein SoxY